MKKLVLLAATLGSMVAFAAPKAATSPKDVLSNLEDAFNKQDAKALGQQYAKNATLITPDGQTHHGQATIEKDASKLLENFKGAKSEFKLVGERPIGASAIWVDATHQASNVLQSNGKRGDAKFHVVMLLEKHAGQWQIVEARPYALQAPGQMGTGGAGGK